jgi:hypothetical protein
LVIWVDFLLHNGRVYSYSARHRDRRYRCAADQRAKNSLIQGGTKMGEHNRHKTNETETIKRIAYELWEKDGHKHGNDQYYWLHAEKAVKSEIKK